MRIPMGIASAILFLMSGISAWAIDGRDWEDCKSGNPGRTIGGCTRMLNNGGLNAHDRSAIYNNRAIAWDAKGNHERAIADHNESIRLNPNAAHYYNRCAEWRRQREYERAIADCTEAIKLNPKHADAYNNRSRRQIERSRRCCRPLEA